MRVAAMIAAVAALLSVSMLAVSTPARADPTVSVVPSTGLARGDVVRVSASGLEPLAAVRVIQCDVFLDNPDEECFDNTTTTADPTGGVSLDVTLGDPVFHAQEFGDPKPVYCKSDTCHIFLVWFDANGVQQVASSDALEFTGSPATISASPSTDLRKTQRVAVQGTAIGAEGRRVQIVEEACFGIVQGSGCYGALPAVTTTVRADGTFSTHYRVKRFLSDGTDCTGDILGFCELSVIVPDAAGNPDDTFGISRIGQPAVALSFSAR